MRWLVLLCLLCGVAQAREHTVTGYKHGKKFRLRVVEIGWAEVEVSTARAYRRMEAAAKRDGVKLGIWSGFRSYERQAELYKRWRRKQGNLAAQPGFSNHQSGRALDLVIHDDRVYAWLEKHARRFGFRRTVRGEPWHWEFFGTPRAPARRPSRRQV